MPGSRFGSGATTAATLAQRQRRGAGTLSQPRQPFDTFLAEQQARILRTTAHQVARVRARRRRLAQELIKREAPDLELTVRGNTGSDAHPDVDPVLREVL